MYYQPKKINSQLLWVFGRWVMHGVHIKLLLRRSKMQTCINSMWFLWPEDWKMQELRCGTLPSGRWMHIPCPFWPKLHILWKLLLLEMPARILFGELQLPSNQQVLLRFRFRFQGLQNLCEWLGAKWTCMHLKKHDLIEFNAYLICLFFSSWSATLNHW